jgi:ribosomal protein S18 acetylase RimI-like enzyme
LHKRTDLSPFTDRCHVHLQPILNSTPPQILGSETSHEFAPTPEVHHRAGGALQAGVRPRSIRSAHPDLMITRAAPEDATECVHLRGLTRENAISADRLKQYGVTADSWAEDVRNCRLAGWVAREQGRLCGYCFGHVETGEVVVLALLPDFEGQGLGRQLLAKVTTFLFGEGHTRLFLGCSADPAVRSFGFYRHLGWASAGTIDAHGDEVLELHARRGSGVTGQA